MDYEFQIHFKSVSGVCIIGGFTLERGSSKRPGPATQAHLKLLLLSHPFTFRCPKHQGQAQYQCTGHGEAWGEYMPSVTLTTAIQINYFSQVYELVCQSGLVLLLHLWSVRWQVGWELVHLGSPQLGQHSSVACGVPFLSRLACTCSHNGGRVQKRTEACKTLEPRLRCVQSHLCCILLLRVPHD